MQIDGTSHGDGVLMEEHLPLTINIDSIRWSEKCNVILEIYSAWAQVTNFYVGTESLFSTNENFVIFESDGDAACEILLNENMRYRAPIYERLVDFLLPNILAERAVGKRSAPNKKQRSERKKRRSHNENKIQKFHLLNLIIKCWFVCVSAAPRLPISHTLTLTLFSICRAMNVCMCVCACVCYFLPPLLIFVWVDNFSRTSIFVYFLSLTRTWFAILFVHVKTNDQTSVINRKVAHI